MISFWWIIFAPIILFFIVFTLKIAVLEWPNGQSKPGGFEVKPTGWNPVLKKKENDHG